MEELRKIISEVKEDFQVCGLKVKDEIIAEQSVDIYLSRQISKDQNKRQQLQNQDGATEKQIWKLRKMGYEGETDNLSKMDASALINELTNKIVQTEQIAESEYM